MALNSFGAEISSGTFSSLLAQPVSRLKIWQTKILAARGLACWSVGVCHGPPFYRAFSLQMPLSISTTLFNLFFWVGIVCLVVFSGGLWTVLLLRQVAAAFWFTLLVPGAIAGDSRRTIQRPIRRIFGRHGRERLGLYSLAGFFFARWLFFRAQDVQWSGGAIVMPEMRGCRHGSRGRGRRGASLASARRAVAEGNPVASIAIRHGAARCWCCTSASCAVRKFGHDQTQFSDMEFVLEIFWGLWLVLPMLVGAPPWPRNASSELWKANSACR